MTNRTDQPWIPKPGHDESYALFHKDRRVVVDDGTPIAYTIRNPDGPETPILFANGWSCGDSYWGRLVTRLVERGHPCIVPDTRGHGASGLPRAPGRGAANLSVHDLSMGRIARDLVAVADDAGADRIVVVGHSMGTQVALEIYRQVPDRVEALVLMAGTYENPAKTFYGRGIGDRLFPIGALLMRVAPEILAPVWMSIGPANVGHFGARLAKAAGPKCSAQDLHPYLLHLKSTNPAVMVLMAAAMREHSAADLLPQITVPTLVVSAGSDVFTPARCSEAMHHQIPGSEIVTFADAGHTLPVEEPEAIAAKIDDFLARRVTEPTPEAQPTAKKTTTVKKATAKKTTAKKTTAKKTTAKKTTAKKTTAKKASAKKTTAKKATANKSAARKARTQT